MDFELETKPDKGCTILFNIECSMFNKQLYCTYPRDVHMKASFFTLCADRPICNAE